MLAVSTAIVAEPRTRGTLDEIAAQACSIATADSAAILQITGQERFRIVGSYGLSDDYRRMLHEWPTPLAPGHGPSGLAVEHGQPVVSEDFRNDRRFTNWAAMPLCRAWRAVAAFPLIVDDSVLGTLVLYRTVAQPWNDEEIRLLGFVAQHAAVAVRTAQLIEEQRRQVVALERLVRGLREQTHEHANRLHAIAGMLVLNDPEEALAFVQELTTAHLSDRVTIDGSWPSGAVTALLRVETLLARHRSIELRSVINLPKQKPCTALTDAQAVTIIGNLLDNALEAVAEMPSERRRVELTITHEQELATIRVRDYGLGLPDGLDPFQRGTTGKVGHAGFGLALVREAVIAAFGDIVAEPHRDGTTVEVTIPIQAGPGRPETRSATAESLTVTSR